MLVIARTDRVTRATEIALAGRVVIGIVPSQALLGQRAQPIVIVSGRLQALNYHIGVQRPFAVRWRYGFVLFGFRGLNDGRSR